jgi:drug/metabolite transporter (DMT)-like permease
MTDKSSAIKFSSVAAGGTALACGGVLCFSLTFPATVWALGGLGPWAVVGLRAVLAAMMAAACLVGSRAELPRRADWPSLLVVGGGCVVGYPLLTTLALQRTSAAFSAVVIGLLPLATAAFGALRRARQGRGLRLPRAFWWAAVAGAIVVAGFIMSQGTGRPGLADLYLFGALLVCAAGYAEGGALAAHMPGWQVIGWGLLAALPATLLLTGLGLATEPVRLSTHAVAGLAYMAVSQFGGMLIWYRGMAVIGVPRASQLQLAQPLLTLVWSALLLGEHMPPAAPAAAIAVAACIVVTQRVPGVAATPLPSSPPPTGP